MDNEKDKLALLLMLNKWSVAKSKFHNIYLMWFILSHSSNTVVLLLVVLNINQNCLFMIFLLIAILFTSYKRIDLSNVSCSRLLCDCILPSRAHMETWPCPARSRPASSGSWGKVTNRKGMAFRFIKFIDFFTNGWTQFPPNFLIMQICKISNLDQLGTATASNLPV